MKRTVLTLLSVSLLFFLFSVVSLSSSVQVSLNLNPTQVGWEGEVNASGTAETSGGEPFQGNISVKLEDEEICRVETNSQGFYNCTFQAPSEINDFSMQSYALQDGTVVSKSGVTQLSVIYSYGGQNPVGGVSSLELPLLVQDLNGKVHKVRVNLKIWD